MSLFKKKEEAVSFETITLKISGMRGSEEYEIVCKGDVSELTHYLYFYRDGKETREPQNSVTLDNSQVLTLLNGCNVIGWNGFSGANPRGVLDGRMIQFNAAINGRKIYASGSNNFPKHYREFRDGLYDFLHKGEQ